MSAGRSEGPAKVDAARVPRRPEPWTRAAWLLLASAIVLVAYLGSRPAGIWPVRIYRMGPILLPAVAFGVALFGLITALRRRPFLDPVRFRAFACLALVIAGVSYPIPFPARREGHPSAIEFRLPVRGEWTVLWGGEHEDNLLARTRADRRWGLDLVVVRDGSTKASGPGRTGARLADYYAWDQPVYAPAAGRVALVVGDWSDRPPHTAPERERPEFGNVVAIEVAPAEFAFLCGLRQGSVLVGEGDEVAAGQELARVGNSSASRFTPEPHLAIHLQDTAVPRWGQAVPWFFTGYRADGELVLRGLPAGAPRSGGSRVRALDPPDAPAGTPLPRQDARIPAP